jgi:predicted phage baseplate assembly protein
VSVINVVAATGGRDRESVRHARQFGPRTAPQPLVAVTAEDYSRAAQAVSDASGAPLVQRANADLRWTGSWLTVTLALDPTTNEGFDAALRDQVIQFLEARRLVGYDLEVIGPTYVPLEIEIELCVRPDADGAQVAQQVQRALEQFFTPQNFTFGDAVYVSRLFELIMANSGVGSARIARLAEYRAPRADAHTAANLAAGVLTVQSNEIVQLDNDRNFPERGLLTVSVVGVAAA